MQIRRLPELVIASDWSKNEEKRWMVRAELIDQENYLVSPPEPVGVPADQPAAGSPISRQASRGTDVPVRISLFPFSTRGIAIPD